MRRKFLSARGSRVGLSLAGVGLALCVLAGCGDGTGDSAAAGLTTQDFAEQVEKAVKGKSSARVVSNVEGVMSMEGHIYYGSADPTLELTLTQGSGPQGVIRVVKGKVFLSVPPFVPANKFFEVDADTPVFGEVVDAVNSVGPADTIGALSRVQKVEYVGEADVDGDGTTHYEVVLGEAEEVQSGGSQAQRGQSPSQGASASPARPYDIYLNSDLTLRRIVIRVEDGVDVTTDYTDWGRDFEIRAPKGKALVKAPDLSDLLEEQGGTKPDDKGSAGPGSN